MDIHSFPERSKRFNEIYEEIQIPLMVAILFFIFQLPYFKKHLLCFFPNLFETDGNYNLQGYIFSSAIFAMIFYLIQKINNYFEIM